MSAGRDRTEEFREAATVATARVPQSEVPDTPEGAPAPAIDLEAQERLANAAKFAELHEKRAKGLINRVELSRAISDAGLDPGECIETLEQLKQAEAARTEEPTVANSPAPNQSSEVQPQPRRNDEEPPQSPNVEITDAKSERLAKIQEQNRAIEFAQAARAVTRDRGGRS